MEDPIMGRRKKKAAKVKQYLENNTEGKEKIVIEDPAETVVIEAAEEMVEAAEEMVEVAAEVEDKIIDEAKPKKKKKKVKSED
jgi:hypothetical protein